MEIRTSVNDAVDRPAYEPPTLVILGSVAELTLGNKGSFIDSNSRGQKKKK